MKLLLHMCCGPCSCYPVKKLREDGIEPTGYFFNPNIHPYTEWDERLRSAKKFAELKKRRTWLPMLLEGKLLKGPIRFGPDNSHVEDMRLKEVDSIMESELLARIDLYINE